jgi:hypothetical protein
MATHAPLPTKAGTTANEGEVSPSSTLDFLPSREALMGHCTVAVGARHQLRICSGGVRASGDSGLVDEGDVFIGHLGVGCEWGEPVADLPVRFASETAPIVEVAAGDLHSLFLDGCGAVWSCGGGWEGVLGLGDESSHAVPRHIRSLAAVRVERVAAGSAHSLALTSDGAVWSWGWGRHGQLGHGDRGSLLVPRRIEALEGTPIIQIAAGTAHTIANCARGRLFSFGRGGGGQCGHACTADELLPRPIDALAGVELAAVRARADTSEATTTAGDRYLWGSHQGSCILSPVRG